MLSTDVGDIFTSPSDPTVPNWLSISAATPAACGDAMDVPEIAPQEFSGSVERTPVIGLPVLVPPGAVTSVAPLPQFEYDVFCFWLPRAATPTTPAVSAGTTSHSFGRGL